MDCEKFDQHVVDALYEELDELTAAALRRHTDGCARCAPILAGLRRAREVAVLPLEEPSSDLEARILAAERVAVRRGPWYRKVVRGAAWAGSLAMRPQLAMAALFFLVVGSSLLLLRARPGTVGAPLQVTQRGEPGPTSESDAQSKSGDLRIGGNEPERGPASRGVRDPSLAEGKRDNASPPAAAPAAQEAALATATAAATASPGSAARGDAAGALADARAARAKDGCLVALPRFDDVSDKYPSAPEAQVAKREASECEKEMTPALASPPPPMPSPSPKMHAAPTSNTSTTF